MDDSVSGNSTNTIQKEKLYSENGMDDKVIVYIWDMDETLILLKSLLTGTYAKAFNGLKDLQKGVEIGEMWETQILKLCDEYFFYEQIEDNNVPSLDVLLQYDDGNDLSNYDFSQDSFSHLHDDSDKKKLAYRHRVIAHNYEQGLHNILDQETIKDLDSLYDATDSYTDKWFTSARAFMKECSGGIWDSNANCIHVLVTSGALVPSLVKCLLFRLDHLITHNNVYSSSEVGKLRCFSRVQERFDNPNTRFCVIGDGLEECDAAEKMKWPFIKIDSRPNDSHRFPGLTVKTLGYYLSVIYGSPKDNM